MESYSQFEEYVNFNLKELDQIRTSESLDTDSSMFINQLKRSAYELSDRITDQTFDEHFREIINFKTYDELRYIPRWWRKLVYMKFRPNYFKNWNEKGKYLSDLEGIEIMLGGLKYKIENRQ